jgi:hypothetical protein
MKNLNLQKVYESNFVYTIEKPPATKDFTSNNTNMEIDPNISSRVIGGDELKQARDKRINLKFTPRKEATSPLRIPQREGYHQEPPFLIQFPQRKSDAHQEKSIKDGQCKRSRVLHMERALNGRHLTV